MRKAIMMGLIGFFLTSSLVAQDQKPYSYEFEKGTGTCTFTSATFDGVWSAINRTLVTDKFRITTTDKQAGTIVAERRPFAAYNYRLSLYIEQVDQDIRVTSSIEPVQRQEGLSGLAQKAGQNKAHEKLEKQFFDKVGKLLYK